MILVFLDENDYSASVVVSWLYKLKQKFKIIGKYDINNYVELEYADGKNIILSINGEKVFLHEVTAIFFRRGHCKTKSESILKNLVETKYLIGEDLIYLASNLQAKREFVSHHIGKIKKFGNELAGRLNKTLILELADELKLNVPNYILTTSKKELLLHAAARIPSRGITITVSHL